MSARRYDPAAWQEAHRDRAVNFSNRQFPIALRFENYGSRLIPREIIDLYKGGTINSFLARGYLVPYSSTHSKWTAEGSAAVKEHMENEAIFRKPSGRFSDYLSLATYDEKPKRANLQVVA